MDTSGKGGIQIELPSSMTAAAKKKLHELVDELVRVEEDALPNEGSKLVPLDQRVRLFREAICRKNKDYLAKYVQLMILAGEKGVTLAELRTATGKEKQSLGGVASAVTRIWHRHISKYSQIVERGHDTHRLTPEALSILGVSGE